MKASIYDDSIESAISNGQTSKRNQRQIYSQITNDLDRTMKKLHLEISSDNKRREQQVIFERDLFKPQDSYNYNQFYTDTLQIPKHNTRLDNFHFKQYIPPTPALHSGRTGALVFWALGGAVGVLLLMLLANVCKKKGIRTRRGAVVAPRAAAGAGTVQPDVDTRTRPAVLGGIPPQLVICQPADPPNLDLPPPYSECILTNVPAETAPLVHNGRVEIGFRNDEIGFKNDCVAMTTTPNDLVFDNGRIVERLSLDLNKETGQGVTHTDVTDRVVYVDEKSTPVRR